MATLNRSLQQWGEVIAKLWLILIGIVVLFAFPISGIAASFLVGVAAASLVGGAIGVIFAFCFGLFLSVYVWEPHVKRVVYRVADDITEQEKLFERDPATLDIENLSRLQASLTAKLILVNKDLLSRWQKIAALSDGLPNSGDAKRVLVDGIKWLRGFNVFLDTALAQISGKLPKILD